MRLFVFVFCFITFKALFATGQVLEATVNANQVNWNEASGTLSFDLEISAVTRPFYLSFSEIVVVLPKTRFATNPGFRYLKGSSQLMTLGGELLSYGTGIEAVTIQRERQTYFIIKLLPNQFLDPVDFFDKVALIDSTRSLHRIGRFEIRGIAKPGKQISIRFEDDSPNTVMRAFDPLLDFKAVEVKVEGKPLRFRKNLLSSFELSISQETLSASWLPGEALTTLPWKMMISADQVNWFEAAAGAGGMGTIVQIGTMPDVLRKKYVFVKVVWVGKKALFESPIRVTSIY